LLEKITLRSVRVYEEAHAEFSDNINVLLGPNGCGKTTILEGAYALGTARSFRTTRLRELIRIGSERAWVEGMAGDPSQTLRIEFDETKRRLIRNGREVSGIVRFARELRIVALAPEHLAILTGAAEERRRYLDFTLFTLDPGFLEIAQQYRRATRHKQALLRSELPFAVYEDRVLPWDEKLAELGEEIRGRRRWLVRELAPSVREEYRHLSSGAGEAEISYVESDRPLGEELKEKRRTEHSAARALCGPHRDDLEIRLQQQPAAMVASQGEKSSLLLSLKLAEIEIVERVRQERPILILDDIGVTLDRERRKRVFDRLSENPHQALISTPEEEIARIANDAGGRTLTGFAERSPAGFSIAWRGAA
jgi:DNA replication and repair protein RecF